MPTCEPMHGTPRATAARPRPRSAGRIATIALVSLLALGACAAALGQPPPPEAGAPSSAPAIPPAEAGAPDSSLAMPLVVFGDTICTFRATGAGVTPLRRAEIARKRLEALGTGQMTASVQAVPMGGGFMVLVGELYAFMIYDSDATPGSETSETLAAEARDRLARTLTARARALSPGQRLKGALFAVLGTVVLFVLLRILGWGRRRALAWIESKSHKHQGRLRLGDLDFLARFSLAAAWAAKAVSQVGQLVLIALWVIFLLNRFPETRPWGEKARASVLDILGTFQQGLFQAIPGVVAVIVIVLIGKFLTRLTTDVFQGIERGTIHVPFVHPETAGATRRLCITLIWLFAVVVAYPMVPGSDSDAFKGVSVFLGLMITLGSSGVVGHLMSGLVVVYSRALKRGDAVRITDIEGIVTEVGALSEKMVNERKEEFTIPNTGVVGTVGKNYSRVGPEAGPTLSTAVTIGYDAPWRVVHELLQTAADRTAGIRKEPTPVVYQLSLSDFYVEYQLSVRVESTVNRFVVLSALHQNIQDAFNERGVQIMSPHFEGQPDYRVWVPKAKWSQAPGDAPGPGGA